MADIIGFLISFLALLYIFFRQNISNKRQAHPPHAQDEELREEDPFKEFMKAVEKEAVAREVAQRLPPPPPKVTGPSKKPPTPSLEEYRLVSQMESRRLKSSLEERHIKSKIVHHKELPAHRTEETKLLRPSRAQLSIERLANRRDLIIYQEIINKPKSLRSEASSGW